MVPIRQPKVALQHPTWGGVSVQLPVPKAPLFSWSAKSRDAALVGATSGYRGDAEEHHSSPYSRVSASQAMRISGSSHASRNSAWTDFHSFSERPNVMPFWWARNQ